jgi:uncharacterized small protein (DUF1192 family)
MKTTIFRTMLIASLMITCLSTIRAQLSFENPHLFIGPRFNPVSAAGYPNVFITTNFGIEYSENGLNIWRPYPATYYGNYKMFIDETGIIGIGRKPTTYALEVNGVIWTPSGPLIASDQSLMKNIVDINNGRSNYLDKLLNLSGKSYEKQISSAVGNADEVARMMAAGKIKKDDASAALEAMNINNPTVYKKELGFIAQEVKEFFPELVEENAEGLMSINYTGLIPLLLESIKEQRTRIEYLSSEIEKLKTDFSFDNRIYFPANMTGAIGIANPPLAAQCKLYQNAPSPFTQNTQIKFYIEGNVKTAQLCIYDLQGKQIKQFLITQRGESSQLISGSELSAGMYLYTLIVDENAVDTKKMILTK